MSPLPRLAIFSRLTQGLRPGLTAISPLRGCWRRDARGLFHREISLPVATQSLTPVVFKTQTRSGFHVAPGLRPWANCNFAAARLLAARCAPVVPPRNFIAGCNSRRRLSFSKLRLDQVFTLLQGLRPGLTAISPLRGCWRRDARGLFHREISLPVATVADACRFQNSDSIRFSRCSRAYALG